MPNILNIHNNIKKKNTVGLDCSPIFERVRFSWVLEYMNTPGN